MTTCWTSPDTAPDTAARTGGHTSWPGSRMHSNRQPVTQAGFNHDKLAVYVWRSVRAGGLEIHHTRRPRDSPHSWCRPGCRGDDRPPPADRTASAVGPAGYGGPDMAKKHCPADGPAGSGGGSSGLRTLWTRASPVRAGGAGEFRGGIWGGGGAVCTGVRGLLRQPRAGAPAEPGGAGGGRGSEPAVGQ